MPEFILDHGSPAGSRAFAALDTFTQGYAEALFWTDCNADRDDVGEATFVELAPAALASIVEDCRDFQDANADDLAEIDDHQAGVDFWLTRNRHGAGFWDRGHGDKGKRLTEAAHAYGACDVYRGDDGLLYLS